MQASSDAADTPNRATDIALPGYLVVPMGGAGKASALSMIAQHRAAGGPFAMRTVAIDTDPQGLEAFDRAINLATTREAVSAIRSNPRCFGPACRALVRHYPYLLDPETLGRGARTHRLLTQAAFEIHEDAVINGFRTSIHDLLKQQHAGIIQPVLLCSLGGGTGSAAALLVPHLLATSRYRDRILLGLSPDILAKPVIFAVDPYAHALQQTNEIAPDWILGNIYATRTELAEYEKAGKGCMYTIHLGLGNNAGAVFSAIDMVCEANGLLAWEWMANYTLFRSRTTDTLDFTRETCRYQGDDIPESRIPKQERPPYAADRPDIESGAPSCVSC
jgi:hypothetical protein